MKKFQPDLALAFVAMWKMNQQTEYILSLPLSLHLLSL